MVCGLTLWISHDDELLIEFQQMKEWAEEQVEPPEDQVHVKDIHDAESLPVELT